MNEAEQTCGDSHQAAEGPCPTCGHGEGAAVPDEEVRVRREFELHRGRLGDALFTAAKTGQIRATADDFDAVADVVLAHLLMPVTVLIDRAHAEERARWDEAQCRYEALLDLYGSAMHRALREPARASEHIRGAFAELDRRARADETVSPEGSYERGRVDGAAEERERIAAALLVVDPVEWALAGQHAGVDAARIARSGGAS